MLGTEFDIEELLDELVVRAGVDPSSAVLKHAPYRETKRYLAERGLDDDRLNGHPYNKSEFFRGPLPAEAIAALVKNLSEGRVPGQSRELDFTPWAGAYNRVSTEATAFAHRLRPPRRALPAPARGRRRARRPGRREGDRPELAGAFVGVRAPVRLGGVYPNFPDPDLEGWARAYHGENLERLMHLKGRYDPDSFFRFHQSLPSRALRSGGTPANDRRRQADRYNGGHRASHEGGGK